MKTKNNVKITVAALLVALLFCSAALAKKPNFLFIIVDDQSPLDLKMYNPRSILDTPNIDRLAKEGMVLDGTGPTTWEPGWEASAPRPAIW